MEIAIGAAALFLAVGGLITALISMHKARTMSVELKEAEVEHIRKATEQRKRAMQVMFSKVKKMEEISRQEQLENKKQSATH
ncbi:MAG: hypothetical protein HN578_05125 [Rhodospirillales bacterium]|jgi:hypothetical protein|nr:hypothetical protein [Rhodospirillales bacterium]MBT3907177.1 hypothetical protein [Rhodospirillaceae bacterium]MBT5034412.1 hypothetical protein [Rhodospirillaceae bacterium]MBT6222045.1 hypothetical protein [Rhodospirillaceae bacterium]MBT6364541.1 hypothetical protein [Rhodospirillaceae bacterium]